MVSMQVPPSTAVIDPAYGAVQQTELDRAPASCLSWDEEARGVFMTFTLYSMQNSGNCYKPRLLMHLLGIDFKLVDVDSGSGETRAPEFLALNPNGRVPLLALPDGRRLSESDAMLLYL